MERPTEREQLSGTVVDEPSESEVNNHALGSGPIIYSIGSSIGNNELHKEKRRGRHTFDYRITKDSLISLHPSRKTNVSHRCVQFIGRTVDQVLNQEYTSRGGDTREYKMSDLKYDIRNSWIVLSQPFETSTDIASSFVDNHIDGLNTNSHTCVCCQEDFNGNDGLLCKCGVFICGRNANECLRKHSLDSISEDNIGKFMENDAKIQCFYPCKNILDDWELASQIDKDIFTKYQDARFKVLDGKISRKIEKQFDSRLQDALQALKTHDEKTVDDMVFHINEEILTLKCPIEGCKQAFFDFDACCALECSRCKTSFCAWCGEGFKKSKQACHRHVLKCDFNIEPIGGLFTDTDTINKGWNARRSQLLEVFFSTKKIHHVRSAISKCDHQLTGLQFKLPDGSTFKDCEKEPSMSQSDQNMETDNQPIRNGQNGVIGDLIEMGFSRGDAEHAFAICTQDAFNLGTLEDCVRFLLGN